MNIDGLPCKGITKIDAFKLETKTAKADIGFIIPANEIKAWQSWLVNKSPKNGTIQYNMQKNGSYFTVELKDAKPLSVTTTPNGDLHLIVTSENALINFSEGILSDVISDINL